MAIALSDKLTSAEISLTPVDNRRLMNLCGRLNEHLHQIEERLGVEIHNRGNIFQIHGNKDAIQLTQALLLELYALAATDNDLTPAKIHLPLQESFQVLNKKRPQEKPFSEKEDKEVRGDIHIKTPKIIIKAHSANQKNYIKHILSNDITFGIGPAGTGKTYLAVACAVAALEAQKVQRIILVRPAVEAGENLGFLPGDLTQKIDPYLRPLYDALYEMLGFDKVSKLIERSVIELAPLAYMRGRTLNDAFIILDESQNTTRLQMKMFLTRLGFGSTAVITGDITQVDLPHGTASGLQHALEVLKDIPGMNFSFFEASDVVRHPIVQKIVDAYEKHEHQHVEKRK